MECLLLYRTYENTEQLEKIWNDLQLERNNLKRLTTPRNNLQRSRNHLKQPKRSKKRPETTYNEQETTYKNLQ